MTPRALVNRLPQRFACADAENLDDLKQAILKDLQNIVAAQTEILNGLNDYQGMYAKDGNILIGNAAMQTSGTKGFLYIPQMVGSPSGTPSNYSAGAPIVFDRANNKIWVYQFTAAAWKSANVL